MNKIRKAILIVFFIFMVNTALAVESSYVSLTMEQGEEISRITSFTGYYDRLFFAADASGTAASWVTPRHINFGTIDPKETIEREYIIRVPENQNPGNYKITWTYSCRFVDGYACRAPSNTVILLTVKAKAKPTLTTTKPSYLSLTMTQGEKRSLTLTRGRASNNLVAWADASGYAASWVTPRRINHGTILKGESDEKYYTIRIPENQRPGDYEFTWTWGCTFNSGGYCPPGNDVVVQITVKPGSTAFTDPKPVYTPTSDNSEALGVIIVLVFILVFIIITIYIIVWIAKDANSRGENGTLWGIVVFFLGLIGILIYFITRPKGKLAVCNHCGKNKLEILGQCPHCKNFISPVSTPSSIPTPAPSTTATEKPEEDKNGISGSEIKELKEKLRKTNQLLEKLDEKLVQGEITEAKYKELSDKYRDDANSMKNLIAEKELLWEVGLKDE